MGSFSCHAVAREIIHVALQKQLLDEKKSGSFHPEGVVELYFWVHCERIAFHFVRIHFRSKSSTYFSTTFQQWWSNWSSTASVHVQAWVKAALCQTWQNAKLHRLNCVKLEPELDLTSLALLRLQVELDYRHLGLKNRSFDWSLPYWEFSILNQFLAWDSIHNQRLAQLSAQIKSSFDFSYPKLQVFTN